MTVFVTPAHDCPGLTASQMVKVDRVAVAHYRLGLVQMMENAGRNLARLARAQFLNGDPRGRQVTVLAGSGGNGGGVLVAARHLHNWGAQIEVILSQAGRAIKAVPRNQLTILRRMGVSVRCKEVPPITHRPDLLIDGLIGYSLRGAPTGAAADLIRWANHSGAPILSMDVPSGLDATTGAVAVPTIRAAATLALALPKTGLQAESASAHVGDLYLADIGIPPLVYKRLNLKLQIDSLFAQSEIIRVR